MIAPRLLARDEYAPKLAEFGCKLIEESVNDPDPYYRWSYWRTRWGFHFFIPELGQHRMTPEHRFFEILADVARQKPQG
jgi:hypothetical protein